MAKKKAKKAKKAVSTEGAPESIADERADRIDIDRLAEIVRELASVSDPEGGLDALGRAYEIGWRRAYRDHGREPRGMSSVGASILFASLSRTSPT
jgi:hypothetical protein